MDGAAGEDDRRAGWGSPTPCEMKRVLERLLAASQMLVEPSGKW